MSEETPTTQGYADRVLLLDLAVVVLMAVGVLGLVGYAILLGPLTTPSAESSFGLALALMFVMGAIAFHVVDRAYRLWPLGRRVHPTAPAPITDAGLALALRVAIFVAAAAAVAYILGTLITA